MIILPRFLLVAGWTILACGLCSAAFAAAEPRRRFDLPAGDAAETLARFAEQANREIIYSPNAVRGVKTNAVTGEYAPREALDLLVARTPLVITQDAASGALAVRKGRSDPKVRGAVANRAASRTNAADRDQETAPPAASPATAATPLPAPTAGPLESRRAENDIVALSPFVVQQDPFSGYAASQTLAGGRLRQDLRDTGASIQVITKEFMNDIGATGIEELFQYTTSTEVGGILGNFTGATGDGTPETFTDDARRDPDGTSRIRGLGAPDRTRNFFKTSIPFDSYNTGRVEINRGANSFLFGLGAPSGLVNTEMAKAGFKDSGEVSTRLGSGGKTPSYRGSFNLNRVLLKDQLAIYVATLMDRTKYRQEPTFKNDDRQYGAITFRPFKNEQTVISGHIENGRIRGNAPDVLIPWEALSTFLNDPVVGRISINVYDNLQRFGNSEGPTQAQYNALSAADKLKYRVRDFPAANTLRNNTFGTGTYGLVYDGRNGANPSFAYTSILRGADIPRGDPFWDPTNKGNGNPYNVYHGDLFENNGTGWVRPGFLDLDTFDFSRANLGWDNDSYGRDFLNVNGSLQQLFWGGKAGFEIAYDYQDLRRTSNTAFNTIYSKIHFDINETLLLPSDPNYLVSKVITPMKNPNYGRPFVVAGRPARDVNNTEQKAGRFTGFVTLNPAEWVQPRWLARVLGTHTFSALLDQSVYDERFVSYTINSFGDPDPALHIGPATARLSGSNDRNVPRMVYIGPPQLNAFTDPKFTIHDFVLEPAKFNLNVPKDYSISKLSWNLGPDSNNSNLGSTTRINGNERFVEGIFTPREVPSTNYRLLQTKVESVAFNAQSYFLERHLVVNTGYREDTVENWVNTVAPLVGVDQIPDLSPSAFRLKDGVFTKVKASVFAFGSVLHLPREKLRLPRWASDLSLHYNRSDNFVPAADRVDAYGHPLDSPAGVSKDYGVTISLWESKVVARLNWYENSLKGATSNANPNRIYGNIFSFYGAINRDLKRLDADNNGVIDPGIAAQLGPGQSVAQVYPSFERAREARRDLEPFLTEQLRNVYHYQMAADGSSVTQSPGNVRDTQDVSGRGLEAEIIFNPTRDWRIAINAAKQETILTNIAPRFDALLRDFWMPYVLKYASMDLSNPTEVLSGDSLLSNTNGQLTEYHTVKGQEGRPQAEQRKWRANLVTRYQFRESFLRGFSVGGAVRWQGRFAYGYPIYKDDLGVILPVIDKPFIAPPETSFDVTFGYRRRILRSTDWNAQLIVRNVQNWSGRDVTIIRVQPDGTGARARFDPPGEILLTNTFRF